MQEMTPIMRITHLAWSASQRCFLCWLPLVGSILDYTNGHTLILVFDKKKGIRASH
jgi:hypothetical protein